MALKAKYQAATLIETMIAMVIMAVILMLGIVFFDNLWRLGSTEREVVGRSMSREMLLNYSVEVQDHALEPIIEESDHRSSVHWKVNQAVVMHEGDTVAKSRIILVEP